jgi:hypothetical protein
MSAANAARTYVHLVGVEGVVEYGHPLFPHAEPG